jgi:hypothetical protein
VAHAQGERRLLPPGLGQQVEQVPLRHHGDVAVRQAQPSEVDDGRFTAVGQVDAPALELGVRQGVELPEQAEFVE